MACRATRVAARGQARSLGHATRETFRKMKRHMIYAKSTTLRSQPSSRRSTRRLRHLPPAQSAASKCRKVCAICRPCPRCTAMARRHHGAAGGAVEDAHPRSAPADDGDRPRARAAAQLEATVLVAGDGGEATAEEPACTALGLHLHHRVVWRASTPAPPAVRRTVVNYAGRLRRGRATRWNFLRVQ